PEDIQICIDGRLIRIHAKRQLGEDLTEVRRTLCLPREADNQNVKSRFSRDGWLIVRAHCEPQRIDIQLRHRCPPWRPSGILRRIRVSVRDFGVEDISASVTQDGARLLVRAKRLDWQLDGRRLHRYVKFEAPLPMGFNSSRMTTNLKQDGWLELRLPAERR
uniref:SHSP domain-containing protein n=1 Tax=Macrostomum lignano TaxID=282301 RepID=A0A1I8GQQ8_9PLAT